MDIAPGDLLVFYTDGVTEVIDSSQKEFGLGRLQAVVEAHTDASALQILEAVVNAVDAYAGEAPPFDDLTMVVVRRCPA